VKLVAAAGRQLREDGTEGPSRRILCVFPAYVPSFGTFEYSYALRGNTRAFMPPQGILVIAAYLPKGWEVRFVDENMRRASEEEFAWADAVFVSGMHVQRQQINDINRRAHLLGKVTALGGPSVSGCPDYYPDFDYLHLGELGDATDALIARLATDPARPARQVRLETVERVPLTEFPVPAYRLARLGQYFLGSVQFSSGCPYRCEFCDIPALYGRNPRLKTPEQVVGELEEMLAGGVFGSVYFVDDNFIGNRKAARDLVAHLVEWQKRRGYPVRFACEATINITKYPELLAMMREAYFTTVFCGIETPEIEALHAMAKDQNTTVPILEAIAILNSYGMEVVSGIILGLDSDTKETEARLNDFIRRSNIPMLTINLLQALPRTPLFDRLKAAGRLVEEEGRESNVLFRMPYDEVVAMWRRCIAESYGPEEIYRRFAYNIEHTYPNRIKPPLGSQLSWTSLRRGLRIMTNLLLRVGLLADYRRTFWAMAWPLLKAGRIEDVIQVALVAHHLISFARDAVRGRQNASFYSPNTRSLPEPAALAPEPRQARAG
jgi:hopanoid C-2 methylase